MNFLYKGLHMELKENERIDDLELNNLKIIQNKNWFCFGIDSVLLSDFAKDIHKNSNILDLGAGNGILELLISAKVEGARITGVEVQREVCEMANRSILLNNLNDRVQIKNLNINDFDDDIKYDAVVTNPPYKESGQGLKSVEIAKLIARHEELASLEDFIRIASMCLKDKGAMYMVNRPERLVDVFEFSRRHKLEPKELRMVYSKVNTKPVLILVKAVKNANKFLRVQEPLYIYDENGEYSEDVLKIYNKEK